MQRAADEKPAGLPLKTRLRIFRLLVVLLLFLCTALAFVHFMLGLFVFLLSVLGFMVYTMRSPGLWNCYRNKWKRRWKRLKAGLGGTPQSEPRFFAPDHVLKGKACAGEGGVLIDKEDFTLGRDEDCDFTIRGDASISRRHCRIIYRSYTRQYMLEDLRSKYGTYLGARRLEPNTQVLLMDNAEISLNQLKFTFCRREGSPAKADAEGVMEP